MPDRDEVMQWLETCVSGCEEGCPYEYENLVSRAECKADLMRDALALLKEQETGGWISVKDRMPEKNGEYLISTNEGVTSALYERGRRASEWTDYFEGYIDFEPTHWMPLPEPPKEVTGDADTH